MTDKTIMHAVSTSRRARILVVGLALVSVLSAGISAQSAAGAKSFLWKVQSGSSIMYLAGSVHALSADVYPLSPAFTRAFQASTTLVEEIDLGDAMSPATLPGLLSKGTYQDGRTFQGVVSKETAAMVATRLKGSPLSIEMLASMKPWMVMLMLSALDMQKAGLDPALGLDKHFYDQASSAGKPVIGLETAASQLDRFDRMPEALQEQLLRSTLAEMDLQHTQLQTIISAWQHGDAPTLERLLLGSFADEPAAYASLVVERNHNWMPQLETCLARPTPCFVVVGAAHLVGKDGLLALLRAKGYTVDQQ